MYLKNGLNMKRVQREDILDFMTYEDTRNDVRKNALSIKKDRRIHLGEHLTFLFENTDTIKYQIQEMVRTERIVRESDILHEIKTYNELLGEKGGLGCTLLIEISDSEQRDLLLKKWLSLPKHIYLILENGKRTYAEFDSRQVGENRLSSVQYLKFNCDAQSPVKIGCDHEDLNIESPLKEEQKAALLKDLQD